jgi:hypothetical protein
VSSGSHPSADASSCSPIAASVDASAGAAAGVVVLAAAAMVVVAPVFASELAVVAPLSLPPLHAASTSAPMTAIDVVLPMGELLHERA